MPIENRKLKAGTMLVAHYKGKDHKCEVISTPDGTRYRLIGSNKQYKSPSAAGTAVMGGIACNGWRFWSTAADAKAAKTAAADAAASKPAKSDRKSRQKKNGTGPTGPGNGADFQRLPDGRVWCQSCAGAFECPADVEPQGCPEGHQRPVAEEVTAEPVEETS